MEKSAIAPRVCHPFQHVLLGKLLALGAKIKQSERTGSACTICRDQGEINCFFHIAAV